MASSMELAVRQAMVSRKSFDALLADPTAPHVTVAAALQEYRKACHTAILGSFEQPISKDIEDQLWDAHSHLNNRYRKSIEKMRRDEKQKAVEIRKLAKQYLDFIKMSQRFYREYILHLDQKYRGIEELRRIANMWNQNAPALKGSATLSPELKDRILSSVYRSLIQLGDLSRYRASKIDDPEKRNWGPAVGFYELAAKVSPERGTAHHQQAMVSIEMGNHLRTLYHLYRSLSVEKPHPRAKDNLELDFKRIVSAWEKGQLITNDHKDSGSALIAWFVRLHGKYYKGDEFAGQSEMENEVLNRLTVEVKARMAEGTLFRIIIINIAAEAFASDRLLKEVTKAKIESYSAFIRLNVRTFRTLLHVLQAELQEVTIDEGDSTTQARSSLANRLTVVSRRILPGLRVYSTWFRKNWQVLASGIADPDLRSHCQDLWRTYAKCLTALAATFPAQDLPSITYMLEEDSDTIAFKPLMSELTNRVWYVDGKLKARYSDSELERHHPNDEMLARIRDQLINGLELAATIDEAPLSLNGMRFVYTDDPSVPDQLQYTPSSTKLTPAEDPVAAVVVQNDQTPIMEAIVNAAPDISPPYECASPQEPVTGQAAPAVLPEEDLDISRMVDNLVDDDDDDLLGQNDMPPTPPAQTFDDTALLNGRMFGVSSLAIDEYANIARSYTPRSTVSKQPSPTYSAHNSVSSPLLRNMPSIPSLPGQEIWAYNGTGSGPVSPYLLPGSAAAESPLGAPRRPSGYGHSRNLSGHSSRGSIEAFNTSYTVTPLSAVEPSAGRRLLPPFGAPSMERSKSERTSYGQSALYDSPWNSEHGSSNRRTPANGQVG